MSLALHDVTIRLYGRVLIDALSAEVGAGDVLAVMGESGSGKSTLLAYIAGLLEPPFQAEGRVVLDGDDVTAWPVERRRVGLLFQDDLLFPHLNARDNLLFALPAGDRAMRERQADDALAHAGLGGLGTRWPSMLSGGQRSRLSLLRALLARPRALLLDEPFSRLDAALRARIRDFVWNEVRERKVPALLVTHDAHDVPSGARVVQLAAPAVEESDDA